MASHEVVLELAQLLRRDRDLGETAEAGRDSVDTISPAHRVLDRLPGGRHGAPRRGSQRNPHAAASNRGEVLERETGARQGETFHAWRKLSAVVLCCPVLQWPFR